MHMIRLRGAELVGDMTVAGALPRIQMDLARSGNISVGAPDRPSQTMTLLVGVFTDVNMTSAMPVRLMQGVQWVSSDSVTESFSAPYVHRALVGGSFIPGLQLSGAGAPGGLTLGTMRVGGFIGGQWKIPGRTAPLRVGGTASDWNATFDDLPSLTTFGSFSGALSVPRLPLLDVRGGMNHATLQFTAAATGSDNSLGRLKVKGAIANIFLASAGSIGSISALSIANSVIFAGVSPSLTSGDLPTSAADFVASASIRSIALHPHGKNVVGFRNSNVAASSLGTLSLGTTRVANNSPYGFAAGSIGRLAVRDLTNKKSLNFSNLRDPAALAAEIAARGIDLRDLVIRLL
jgi:hypothetical protein